MDAPLYAAATPVRMPDAAPAGGGEVAELLRQVVELQREQLAVARAQAHAHDAAARWRPFLARWEGEFPGVGGACRRVLPSVERAYLGLVQELTERLETADAELDSEFALQEFLDRYGVRLAQLGAVLGALGPLAEAAPPG